MVNQYHKILKISKYEEHSFAKYVRILGKGKTSSRSLTYTEAYDAMNMILQEQIEPVQLGAFLMLLRIKEESPEELAGFVQAARDHIKAPHISVDLDWSSYAGKKKHPPYFLLSCFLLAQNSIRIYMHGTQGHTQGRLYTEQVLHYLGIPIAKNWADVNQQLDTVSFSFMPLQHLCNPLQIIINLRNTLGLRSPVHTLSRLLNPLQAKHSIQSVFHPSYANSHQQAALLLNQQYAAVFKGEGGEIERKPEAQCLVKTITDGNANEEHWEKLLEGRQPYDHQPEEDKLLQIWQGKIYSDYAHQTITGTTAIALKLLNKAKTQTEALELANQYWKSRNKKRLL